MDTVFADWLNRQVREKGWSLRGTAKVVGVSPTAIINLANGTKRPSLKMCQRLSGAFGVTTEEVLRRAGLLQTSPPKPPGGGFRPRRIVYEGYTADRLLELWGLLAPEDQQRVLDLAERLAPPLPEPRIIGDPPEDAAAE